MAVPNPRPNRSFGGLYRTAEHEERGETFGGIPLQTAEGAVVAAVRMGYRVADEQIEQGRRIASRLRGAVDRATGGGLGTAADGMDELIVKAVQTGIEWIEGVARAPEGPLKRLATAQLTLLGSLLGVRPDATEGAAAAPAPASSDAADRSDHSPDRAAESVRIQHDEGSNRAVSVLKFRVPAKPRFRDDVQFHHVTQPGQLMKAALRLVEGRFVLRVNVSEADPPGRWRAAVLDEDRVQLGSIEIEF
jgi:hypothetical protein